MRTDNEVKLGSSVWWSESLLRDPVDKELINVRPDSRFRDEDFMNLYYWSALPLLLSFYWVSGALWIFSLLLYTLYFTLLTQESLNKNRVNSSSSRRLTWLTLLSCSAARRGKCFPPLHSNIFPTCAAAIPSSHPPILPSTHPPILLPSLSSSSSIPVAANHRPPAVLKHRFISSFFSGSWQPGDRLSSCLSASL